MKKNFSVIFLLLALVSTACFAADDTKLDAETQKQVVNKVKEYCTLMQEFSADVEKIDNMETIYAMCENNNVSVFNDLAAASSTNVSDNSMPLQQYMMMVTDKFENNVKTSFSGYKYLKTVVQPSPMEGFDAARYAFVKVDKQVNAPGINATHHLNIIVNTETMKVSSTTSEDFEDPQSIYLKALEKYNKGDYNSAIPLFEKVSVLQRFPGRYRAKSMLGWIYADQEKNEKAHDVLREAAEEDPLGKILLASKILLSDQVPVSLRNSTEGINLLRALGDVRDKEIPQMHLIAKAALYDAQVDLKTMQPKLNLSSKEFEKLANDLISDPQSTALFQIRGYMGIAYLKSESIDGSKEAIEAIEKAEVLLKRVRLPQRALEQMDAQIAIIKINAMIKTNFQQANLLIVELVNEKPYAAPYLALRFLREYVDVCPFLSMLYRVGAEHGDPFSTYIMSLSHYPLDSSGNFRDKYERDWFIGLVHSMDVTQLLGWYNFCIYLITDRDQERSYAEFLKWNQKAVELGEIHAIEDRAYFEACNVPPFENIDIAVALERACKAAVARRRSNNLTYVYGYALLRENLDELNIPFEQSRTYKVLKRLDEQGNGAASFLLYFAYSEKDTEKALYYLERSKDAGYYDGMHVYAGYLNVNSETDKAFELYDKLTAFPNSRAYSGLGSIELSRRHYKEAIYYYQIGRKEHEYLCCTALYDLYKFGIGVEKNLKAAKECIDEAIMYYRLQNEDIYEEDNPTEELKEMLEKRREIEALLGGGKPITPSIPNQPQQPSKPEAQTSSASSNDDIIMPQFPNGTAGLINFLNENIHYPEDAEKQGIHGKVIVSFIVDIDGTIKNVEVVQRVHPSLDAEAVRVINAMPKWKPATKQGTPVRVRYSIPISFSFTGGKTDSSMSPIERINQLIDPSKKENERIALSEELAEKLFASPNSIVKIVDSRGKKAVKENAKIALYAIAKNPTEAFHYVEISSKKDNDNKYIELTLQFRAK